MLGLFLKEILEVLVLAESKEPLDFGSAKKTPIFDEIDFKFLDFKYILKNVHVKSHYNT